jgi:predicted Zn-dependent protease
MKTGIFFGSLDIDIKIARQTPAGAAGGAEHAPAVPLSRASPRQYADALIAANRWTRPWPTCATRRSCIVRMPEVQQLLAKVYAAQGKQALQHLALAESYALNGSPLAAIDQLGIARKAPDATFYDQSRSMRASANGRRAGRMSRRSSKTADSRQPQVRRDGGYRRS